MDGLDHALTTVTIEKAKILWDLLLANSHLIQGVVETATRNDFSNSKQDMKWSFFGSLCRDKHWLPDNLGKFHKPSELFLNDLPEDFTTDTINAKALAEKLGMKKSELQYLAEMSGVPVQHIDFIQQNPHLIERLIEQEKQRLAGAGQPALSNALPSGTNQNALGDAKSTVASSSAASTAKESRSESPRTRLLSYVLPKSQVETIGEDKGSVAADARENINRAGVDRVLAWETQAGRYPTEMSHTHPGYDVESRNEAGEVVRYIEVKSRTGTWDQQGVTLSDTQFHEAQKRGEVYWLYIVENADQDDAQIFRIQDPANHVEYFCFDNGWGGLSE